MKLASFLLALALAASLAPRSSAAAEPIEINAVLSMTGNGGFIGATQARALQAVENVVNRGGGIAGRNIHFVVKDDQSNPQVAVQLAQGIISGHPSVILGPSLAAACDAITPLVQRQGPFLYCLTSSVTPAPGSYVFATLPSTQAQVALAIHYAKARGWKRIASIATEDASGQFAEDGLTQAMSDPSNKGLELVDREHFGFGAISVAAQIARIKAANPDMIVAWAIGPPTGLILHALADAGMTVPIVLSGGDLLPAFTRQFGSLFPTDTYIPAVPFYAGNVVTDKSTKAAIATMTSALAAIDAKPDQVYVSAWDPALLVVDALKKLGPDVAPSRLRDYLSSLRGWVGVNGPYDFRRAPQRGVDAASMLMVKWDAGRKDFRPASRFGGQPLPN